MERYSVSDAASGSFKAKAFSLDPHKPDVRIEVATTKLCSVDAYNIQISERSLFTSGHRD